ncbi:hypothetical protein GCM10009549_10890 [Streptomyces thermoalcalitolerans]|uniref:Translation initiation factor IF-2 n=1 Tax=Streptomyces thermoalcalitolerans TaxID=65605 RepID=A0ABN1NG15_9ACTN
MAGKGSGGSTSFENMSHEQMLAWLDQANASEVQAAADRLMAAAKEIKKIAEELKVRPQWVAWKGEGAEAFRAWANELANSTYRLSDFSEDAAKWLGRASDAIAMAQASIPRDTKGAEANLAAATAARNDPDAAAIRAKSMSELAALKEDREKVRQEAAAQMRKLGQTYKLSATQLNNLERPKFPPPPEGVAPPDPRISREDLARPGGSIPHGEGSGGSAAGPAAASTGIAKTEHRSPATAGLRTDPPSSGFPTSNVRLPEAEPDTHVGIDSVATMPEVRQPAAGSTGGPPTAARPDTGILPPTSGPVPPNLRGSVRTPTASGGLEKTVGGGRLPHQPGQRPIGSVGGGGATGVVSPVTGRNLPGPAGATGRAVPSQGSVSGRSGPYGAGIIGGHPAAPAATGRSAGRAPGTPLVGPFGTGSHAVGRMPNTGVTAQPVTRPAGPTTGRTAPTPRDGIVGGTPQQTGRSPMRPGAQSPSAPTRGGISGGVPSEAGARGGVRGALSGSASRTRPRSKKQKTDRRNEPPFGG